MSSSPPREAGSLSGQGPAFSGKIQPAPAMDARLHGHDEGLERRESPFILNHCNFTTQPIAPYGMIAYLEGKRFSVRVRIWRSRIP
jgi:hypothetical protein